MSITKTHGDSWGLWMDIFTINQHQGEKTKEDLDALDKVIETTDNFLLVIDPRGTALTRVWCLFEIMTAVRVDANIVIDFMGSGGSAYESAMIALSILAGRFDNIDVRHSEATQQSDKDLILKEVEVNPGIDAMNDILRLTLREHAEAEFKKERMPFGSVWWQVDQHFPPFILSGLQELIEEYGGWNAMYVSEAEEAEAMQAHVDSSKATPNWKSVYKGDLARNSPLYKKINMVRTTCIN
jgi:hypothetical protein